MSTPYYMPMFIRDYLGDTVELNATQHGCYLLLLFAAWNRGGELPDDIDILRSLAFCRDETHNKALDLVLARYWRRKANGAGTVLYNKRQVEELARATRVQEARVKGGKSTAAKRWGSSATAEIIHSEDSLAKKDIHNKGSPAMPEASRTAIENDSPAIAPPIAQHSGISFSFKEDLNRLPACLPEAESAPARHDAPQPANGQTGRQAIDDFISFNGKVLCISYELAHVLQECFPNVNVDREINAAGAWLALNPDKVPKDDDGLRAYALRWLTKEARKSPDTGPSS